MLLTTASPSAASVGARIVATSAASAQSRSRSSALVTSVPRAIVRGSPIPSSRSGSPNERRSDRVSIRAAVGEEDQRKRELSQEHHHLVLEVEFDHTEQLWPENQPGDDEQHRSSDT